MLVPPGARLDTCRAAHTGAPGPAAVRGDDTGGCGTLGDDRRERGVVLLAEARRSRRAAGLVGRDLLALLGGDEGEVVLHELRLGGVLVLDAADEVRHERDRVRAVGRRGGADREDEVLVLTALLELGVLDELRSGLGRVLDVLAVDAHGDLAGLLGHLRRVEVADRALARAHDLRDALRALRALGALDRPQAADLVVPDVGSRGGEVGRERLGRARVVGAVDGRDRRVGELDALVLRGDGLVVPRRDLAGEDARDGLGVEVERVDARQVEGERDRRDVGRDLDDAVGGAGLEAALELLRRERTVGADEVGGARDEVVAARARAGRLVADRRVGVLLLEGRGERGLRGRLRRGARRADLARGGALGGSLGPGAARAGGLVRGAAGEGQSGD